MIVAGLCGVFDPRVQVGDVLIPSRIYSEEGTSRHYCRNSEWAQADPQLCAHRASAGTDARVHPFDTVTTDAVYRQTMNKEARWRSLVRAGVDMEASAVPQICAVYGIPAATVLLASDGHPLPDSDACWSWGGENFAAVRRHYINRHRRSRCSCGRLILILMKLCRRT